MQDPACCKSEKGIGGMNTHIPGDGLHVVVALWSDMLVQALQSQVAQKVKKNPPPGD